MNEERHMTRAEAKAHIAPLTLAEKRELLLALRQIQAQPLGPGRAAEEACREIIPLVNQAYEDGLKGVGDYPLNLKEARRGLCGSVFYPA